MKISANTPDDEQNLSALYEAAFAEFEQSGDTALWETTTNDSKTPGSEDPSGDTAGNDHRRLLP